MLQRHTAIAIAALVFPACNNIPNFDTDAETLSTDSESSSSTGSSTPDTTSVPTTSASTESGDSTSTGESTSIGSSSSTGTEVTTLSDSVCGNGMQETDEPCDITQECLNSGSDEEFKTCLKASGCHVPCAFEKREEGPGKVVCTDGPCIAATCGDGQVNQLMETCDDGNKNDEDSCPDKEGKCINAHCGDKFVQMGVDECDDGNDVEDDGCLKCFHDRRVFVTSVAYCGNMGTYSRSTCNDDGGALTGVFRGDARCQEAAAGAIPALRNSLHVKAWLSTSDGDHPAKRFNAAVTKFAGRYVMFKDGPEEVLVASGWSGLIDGMLDVPEDYGIVFNEKGKAVMAGAPAWTNNKPDGTNKDNLDCDDWALTTSQGNQGRPDIKGNEWSVWTTSSCGSPARLYCFEDP